jgi:hypothetical protein
VVAKYGDAFYPLVSTFVGPIDQGQIGLELEWAESDADFRAGKLKTARLFLSPEVADELSENLRRQADAVRQRGHPN